MLYYIMLYNIFIIIIIIFNIFLLLILLLLLLLMGIKNTLTAAQAFCRRQIKGNPLKWRLQQIKIQIGEAWTACRKRDGLQASQPRIFGDYFWCWGKVTKIRLFRQKNSQMEQKRNKILWECYIRSITTLRTNYIKRMHQHGLTCK